jgi:hypothetical protein
MQNWHVCGSGHPPYAPYQKHSIWDLSFPSSVHEPLSVGSAACVSAEPRAAGGGHDGARGGDSGGGGAVRGVDARAYRRRPLGRPQGDPSPRAQMRVITTHGVGFLREAAPRGRAQGLGWRAQAAGLLHADAPTPGAPEPEAKL